MSATLAPKKKDGLEDLVQLNQVPEYIQATQQLSKLEAEERAILAGANAPDPAIAVAADAAVTALADGLVPGPLPKDAREDDTRRLPLIRRAIAVCRGRIESIREQATLAANEACKPAHRRAISKVAAALLELGLAIKAEQQIRDRIEAVGVQSRLAYAGFSLVGANPLSDASSLLHHWIRESINAGVLDARDPSVLAARSHLPR